MGKRYYKEGEKVWLKEHELTGVIQEMDIPNLQARISYFVGKGELKTSIFKFEQIDKLKEKVTKINKKLTILVKYFDDSLPKLEKITKGDWIDLRSAVTQEYKAGEKIKIPLGVAMSLPFGYEAHVAPRSSTEKNFGVIQTNSVGVVDETYRGNDDQWFVPFYALRDGKIEKGDRVCQFRIIEKMPEVQLVTVAELTAPNRGGHGSTGTK